MARTAVRPSIRLRAAPLHEPPFDDEVTGPVWAPAEQLALDLTPARPGPATATVAPADRTTAGTGHPATGGAPGGSPGRTAVTDAAVDASRDARLAVRRCVTACVEVLNGHRPAAHLRRMALPREAAGVVAQATAGVHRVAGLRPARRPTDRHARGPGPVAVLRVRLCEPRAGAVESTVVVVTGPRTWALAVRLELHDQAWLIAALRLV